MSSRRLGRTLALACRLCALAAALAPATATASVAPQSISPNVQVNSRAPGQVAQDFKAPSVAINPADESNVVAATRFDSPPPLYNCQIWHSQDGGASWAAATFQPPSKGSCWAPGVAFDDAGRAYVVAQDRPTAGGGPQQIIVWTSRDRGQSFGAPVVVPASALPLESFATQAGIAVDTNPSSPHRGRVYVTWESTDSTFQDLANLSFSDDQGQTWSPKAERPTVATGNAQEFPKPAVAPDGTVYVVFKDTRGPGCNGIGFGPTATPTAPHDCPLRVLRSSDGGVSFDLDVQAAAAHFTDVAASESAGIAVTPDGTVLVAYAAVPDPPAPGCAADNDALIVRSGDRGASWSAPARLSDDPCGGGASQRDPWIDVAPDGRVDAIFYDDRNDPDRADAQRLFDVLYANSTDGGASFGPSVRLTPASFDASAMFTPIAGGFQTNEYDTFNAIASSDTKAVAAWGDPRNDTAHQGSSDVMSSVIGFVAPARPAAADQGPGAGAVVANPATRFTAKLALARATINRRLRVLDVLAPITARASGRVRVQLQAAGRRLRFTAPIDSASGRIRFRRRIPAAQARLGTGIVTISYAGDADTRPQTVRLRAADRPANLTLARPRLVGGRLQASGTVSRLARGVVRLQLEFDRLGRTEVVRLRAPIANGRWSLNRTLPAAVLAAIAQRSGVLHSYTLFTGYFAARMRGEMRSLQVLGDR